MRPTCTATTTADETMDRRYCAAAASRPPETIARTAEPNDTKMGIDRLNASVKNRAIGKFRIDFALSWFGIDVGLIADFCFDSDKTPAVTDVVIADFVHTVRVAITMFIHPAR